MKEYKPSHRKAKGRRIAPGSTSSPRASNIGQLRADLTRTLEEARQRTAELSLINSVQQALASQLDVQAIYDLVGEKVRAIFNAQVVMISMYDPQANTIEHRYAIERGERVYAPGARPVDGFRYRIIQSRVPLLVNREVTRLMAELGQSVLPGTATPKSWLGVPMFVGRQVTGVLSLQNLDQEEAFAGSDVSLLQTLASSMSVALENARLFSEIRRRLDELATINRISAAFASQWEVGALIQLAGDQIRETFNADIAYVALLDRSSNLIRFPYTFGETLAEMPFGQGLTSKILQTGQPLLINRDLETRRVEIGATQVGTVVKSYLGVPILVGTKAIGAVSVQSIRQEGRFNENDQRLLMTIGATVGAAIENARHFEAEQRRAEQFRVIGEVGHDITSILDVDELLNEIVRAIQTAFGYYVVGIALVEGDELVIKASLPQQWQVLGISPPRLKVGREGVMGRVAGTGEPRLVPDVSREPHYLKWPESTQTRSELVVPLKTKSGVVGVLNVESDRLNAFDDSDMMVLQSLGNQAAIAIENAQHFRTEQRRAEQFRVIGQVGYGITSIRAVDELLVDTAKLIQEAFNYYHVGFGLIEGDVVVYRAGAGALANHPKFQFVPPQLRVGKEGITGWVAATGKTLLIPDVRREPRYVEMQGSRTLSELSVPIAVKGQVIGVLDAQSDRVNAFDETDVSVLQSLALQVGAAIENARLYARAQQVAVMEERNRLARDLHDAVTQTLFSASLIADALPASWESDPEEGRQLLRELRQLSRGALAEMRTLLLELRPATLTESNLASLLRQLSDVAAGREGLSVTVDADLECKLPSEVHVALYRIAQEALNNVVKHSRASQVTVSLHCISSETDAGPRQLVLLCVVDDGRGFDLAGVTPDHFGLGIMRERAQTVGAKLTVESEPGVGTQVRVEWEPPT